ncbi:HAD-IIIA family hydrolase, partial [Candidatus Poribacteria bacterium]|nr:HAD-IIIA family hydrolase [Candidatus Poribacteria bacterium]
MRKAAFLDRDGVINMLVPLPNDPRNSPRNAGELRLYPEAAKAIEKIDKDQWLVIVVSNQPNIAKGKSTFRDLEEMTEKMIKTVEQQNAKIDDVYYCLHHPDPEQVIVKELLKKCKCRKPEPGLLLKAAKDWNIDLKLSWMVGDSKSDIQAGKAAGCQTILVKG